MSRYRQGDDPTFDAMTDDVVHLRRLWPGTHSVAHRDPSSGAVTFHLHVREHDLDRLRNLLGGVVVAQMRTATETTYHFHGRRTDMNLLLKELTR